MVTRELRDIRCCDGDAVTLECKFLATPERTDDVRWEKGGKVTRVTFLSFLSFLSFLCAMAKLTRVVSR